MKTFVLAFAALAISCGSDNDSKDSPPAEVGNNADANDSDEDANKKLQDEPEKGELPPSFSSWDQVNEVDPVAASQFVFSGSNPVFASGEQGNSCQVYLMGKTINPVSQQTQWIIRSSFNHDGDGHSYFLVDLPNEFQSVVSAELADGSQIALGFNGNVYHSSQLSYAKIKWLHGNHFHTDQCKELSISKGLILPENVDSIDQINALDPSTNHLTHFKGEDPFGIFNGTDPECHIYLVAHEKLVDGEAFYFRSSFNHEGHSHDSFKVTLPQESDEDYLLGEDEKSPGAWLKIFGADQQQLLDTMTEVRIKYAHDDHFDNGTCETLAKQ
ncbi:hypothetical protein [Pseudobacteriovorax antillogorgiicola]|uniref:Lipoprotein n=1 Tax=Pseudobacteriovorax antillogorgiicola TaxID=1513793 RepID=A0A1Y6CEJ4_9BACT|nr:hypothetical protein [Pseudobacteriovorax antillogorgiicola]TCS47608.1 hypothetical protein EDD56_12049 [Pseudobacteriovorax antillogorgiicola]SMF60095.1 hypothetical protein SAMN06296036_12091 [Pseudobacteriovorax antillogorgiicola]